MKTACVAGIALLPLAGVCRGEVAEGAALAAMKVSEAGNYSWVSVVSDDAQTYEIEGQTEIAGWTRVTLPMLPSIARRLGRDAEPQIEAVFKPDNSCAIRTTEGWQLLHELPRCHEDWIDAPMAPGNSALFGGPTLFPGRGVAVSARTTLRADGPKTVYSNAQFGVSRPHEELAVIVCSGAMLRQEGETIAGNLTDLGAQLLLVRDGQEHIQPLQAAGAFRLWIKDGVVARYSVQLEGVLKIGRKKVLVRQSSRTVLRELGVTYIRIPDEARAKLGW